LASTSNGFFEMGAAGVGDGLKGSPIEFVGVGAAQGVGRLDLCAGLLLADVLGEQRENHPVAPQAA